MNVVREGFGICTVQRHAIATLVDYFYVAAEKAGKSLAEYLVPDDDLGTVGENDRNCRTFAAGVKLGETAPFMR